jgi:hypothetical protein
MMRFRERGRTVPFLVHPIGGDDQLMRTGMDAEFAVLAELRIDFDISRRHNVSFEVRDQKILTLNPFHYKVY